MSNGETLVSTSESVEESLINPFLCSIDPRLRILIDLLLETIKQNFLNNKQGFSLSTLFVSLLALGTANEINRPENIS